MCYSSRKRCYACQGPKVSSGAMSKHSICFSSFLLTALASEHCNMWSSLGSNRNCIFPNIVHDGKIRIGDVGARKSGVWVSILVDWLRLDREWWVVVVVWDIVLMHTVDFSLSMRGNRLWLPDGGAVDQVGSLSLWTLEAKCRVWAFDFSKSLSERRTERESAVNGLTGLFSPFLNHVMGEEVLLHGFFLLR